MKIAITGGIGSGKSTVSRMMGSLLDYPVFSVDKIVDLLYKTPKIVEDLHRRFGYHAKEDFSNIIFRHPINVELKAALEEFFYEHVTDALKEILKNSDVIVEFPLLVEQGKDFIKEFDFIVNVRAELPTRIQRAIERNKSVDPAVSQKIASIVSTQASDSERESISHITINNDGTGTELFNAVKNVISIVSEQYQMNNSMKNRPRKIGFISGSFDPITYGHLWVINKALDMMDEIVVCVAFNPKKQYMFSEKTRATMVKAALNETATSFIEHGRVRTKFIPEDQFLVNFIKSETEAKNAKGYIFRGIRNVNDFNYESELNLVQKRIAPEIETVYLLTPREYIEISSSMIKGTLGLKGWEKVAENYVPQSVLKKLIEVVKRE